MGAYLGQLGAIDAQTRRSSIAASEQADAETVAAVLAYDVFAGYDQEYP